MTLATRPRPRSRPVRDGVPRVELLVAALLAGLLAVLLGWLVTTGWPFGIDRWAGRGGPVGSGAPYTEAPIPGGAGSQPLSWAPPLLRDPVTYHVSEDGPGTLRARPGQDSVVVWDAPTHRRLRFEGGRHWVIKGAEVNNDVAWPDLDDRSALEFSGATGTVFIEGLLVHGRYGTDGIRLGPDSSDTLLVVQNSRILDRLSQGRSDYHADVIQAFGGVRSLHLDHVTGQTDFQGQMWLEEQDTRFGPSDLRHVNYRGAWPQSAPLVNFVMERPTGAVTLTDVWSDPADGFGDFCRAHRPLDGARCRDDAAGRRTLTWTATPITVHGELLEGIPPGGDLVPKGVAGLEYAAPGYLGGPAG